MSEVPASAPASAPVNVSALLGEAMNKSGIMWIEIPGQSTHPVWFVWNGESAFVIAGQGEQPLPPLPREVRLILRSKDSGGRLLTIRAIHRMIVAESNEWGEVVGPLIAKRLNATDDLGERWAREIGGIHCLTPFDAPLESPGSYAADDLRAPVAATSATTASLKPWHWRGRGRKPKA